MRRAGARHGDGVLVVLQTVGGFVFNLAISRLLLHARCKAAALHHKGRNDAVKHGARVVALVDVVQKVGDGFGGFGRVEFERDNAVILDVQFDFGVGHEVSFSIKNAGV